MKAFFNDYLLKSRTAKVFLARIIDRYAVYLNKNLGKFYVSSNL